jgi:type I restriction enzyme S subunit
MQWKQTRQTAELFMSGSAGQQRVQSDFFRRFKVYAPVLPVQKKIATVLTGIDTAIEKTEALIAKFQQIKAGLMHDLFTRGVLPNGQLRTPREQAPELYQETAIGWIPRGWAVRNLGSMARIVSGVTLGPKESGFGGLEVPYLRVANVQDGYLDLTEIKTVRVTRKELEQLRLQVGDVLMNEGGDFDKLGRGAVWSGEMEDCVHQNHVFRVRTESSRLLPYFLAFYSESSFGKKYFLISSKQSTNLASINSTQLNAYPIALPSREEQQSIISRISAANARIERMKGEAGKLRNQKSGLMHDLLTGKVLVNIEDEATTTEPVV